MINQKLNNIFRDPRTNWNYILIVVILVAIVGGGILAWQYWWTPKEEAKTSEVKPPEKVPPGKAPPRETPIDETTTRKTYRNEEYGFEVKYPEEYLVETKDDEIRIFSPRSMCEYISFGSGAPVKQEESSNFMVFKLHSGVNYNDIWQKVFGFGLTREFDGEIVRNYDGESLIGEKKAKYFFQGAEMEFGRTAYLVEKSDTEAVEINSYVLGTEFNCIPPLRVYPRDYPGQILSTFRFLE